jgi:hypothetical protein
MRIKTNIRKIIVNVFREVLLFTLLYYATNFLQGSHFHSETLNHTLEKISLFDALYYSMVTQTTVGYGDIIAHSTLAKCLTLLQLVGLLLIAASVM